MKKFLSIMLIAAMAMTTTAAVSNAGGSFGAGLHYLHNVGDIDKDTDLSKDSFGILGSYLYGAALLKFEAQLEYIFNYAGTDEAMWMPQAYILAGGMIYGGLGIGIGYIDGDWMSDPLYNLRAGVNLGLGGIGLDAYATYTFWTDDDLKAFTGEDLNSVTLAAILRFGL